MLVQCCGEYDFSLACTKCDNKVRLRFFQGVKEEIKYREIKNCSIYIKSNAYLLEFTYFTA
jgi:hypothetical protein